MLISLPVWAGYAVKPFIGIEYSKYLKQLKRPVNEKFTLLKNNSSIIPYRYWLYEIKYQSRSGEICFINTKTNKPEMMDPKDIAFTDSLISKFNSEQAFFIGVCAGGIIHSSPPKIINVDFSTYLQKREKRINHLG